jgi:hypothetical protein
MVANNQGGPTGVIQEVQLSPELANFADRLLAGSGLSMYDAVRIARGDMDAPSELLGLQEALRAGWLSEEDHR